VKITLRNDERAAIIAALEGEYASDRLAADELFGTVVDALTQRDSFGIKYMGFAFGPWFHGTAVKKLATSLPGSTIHRLHSSQRFEILLDGDTHRKSTSCESCQHPLFAHGFGGRGCVVRKCKCKEVFK
jgi:hypothetical protein